ncbi:MAG: hypothetical protein IT376_01075 [Polyangiaceae bacterium]|nr:hypothetical protein [Polyangiaceae bacterium]
MHHHVPGRVPPLGSRELVAAVHVADALVHSHAPPLPGLPDGTTLDAAFVEEMGLTGRLDAWRELVDRLASEEPGL